MKNRILKKRYFDRGAAALKNIASVDQECYCCPICTRFYIPEALEAGVLTLEHAPPRRVGGKPLCLTCKECNSVSGYSIDSAVVQREKQLDFAKALTGQKTNFEGRATFSIAGETLNIKFRRNEESASFIPLEGINDPRKIKTYQDYMMGLVGKPHELKFQITPDAKYHVKYSKVGDLKTAFIICFARFGYRFALNKRLSAVREQILNYKNDIIDHYWQVSDSTNTQEHFIFLIEKPFSAIAVKLGTSTIILPWLSEENDLYKDLANSFGNKGPVTFDGRFFTWPQSIEMMLDFNNPNE